MIWMCDAKHFGLLSEERSSALSEAPYLIEPVAQESILGFDKAEPRPSFRNPKRFASPFVANGATMRLLKGIRRQGATEALGFVHP